MSNLSCQSASSWKTGVCACACMHVCVGLAGNRCAVIALAEGVGLSAEASLPSQCGAPLPVGLMYGGPLIREPDRYGRYIMVIIIV